MYAGMQPRKANTKLVGRLVEAALSGRLSEAQADQLYALGAEIVTLVLLAASKRIAELQGESNEQRLSPTTPSGMVPIHTKPNTPKRRKKPGARKGHPGHRRETPPRIDKRETHRLECCPSCGGPLQRCDRTRTRTIEDLLEDLRSAVTEHTIWRDYCPKCKQHVEPVVADALPRAAIGHRLVCLTSWFHYGLGITIDQIIEILSYHLQTQITSGGLIDCWHRLAEILLAWYEQIGEQAKSSAVLHADETGWRVNGQRSWLWCFANDRNCYYMIEYCRGSPTLQKFFSEAFEGVLITDFWAAYDSVEAADRQKCLPHLLHELEKVDLRNDSAEWQDFAKKLRRLLRDGMRLRRRPDFEPGKYQSRD
jgi:transposase